MGVYSREKNDYINGLVQDCSISSADALEILQSFTKLMDIILFDAVRMS